jgi:riboflavin biosynthesis pyrimidine reductase
MSIEMLLVEGGAQVVTALLDADVVDRVVVSIAPLLLGSGVDAVGDLGIERVDHALALTDRVVAQVGDDVVIAGTIVSARNRDG